MTTINLRQLAFTRLLVVNRDVQMTPEALKHRVDDRLKGLAIDIPALKTLQGSRLDWLYEPRDTGLYLKFVLQELPQLALQLGAGGCQTTELADLFLQDVDRVKADQGRIVQRRVQAQNPAIDPFEDEQISTIRKRLWNAKRAGEMLIPTGLEPEQCRHDDMPRVLPRGEELEVIVTVRWLSHRAAEVLVHSVVSLEGNGVSRLTPNTKIELQRLQRHQRKETGQRLQVAMDTNGKLKLKAMLAFDWTGGKSNHLVLVDFLEFIEANPDADRRL